MRPLPCLILMVLSLALCGDEQPRLPDVDLPHAQRADAPHFDVQVEHGDFTLGDGLRFCPFGRFQVSLNPYSGIGPYHFDNLTSSPFYARDKDFAVGLRLGAFYRLTSHLMLEIQLPFTANPSPEYQEPLQYYGPLNAQRHLDASIGLLWSF